MFVTRKKTNKESSFLVQERRSNNAKIQNYISFKAYSVRKLANFYYNSRISVREKNLQPFS